MAPAPRWPGEILLPPSPRDRRDCADSDSTNRQDRRPTKGERFQSAARVDWRNKNGILATRRASARFEASILSSAATVGLLREALRLPEEHDSARAAPLGEFNAEPAAVSPLSIAVKWLTRPRRVPDCSASPGNAESPARERLRSRRRCRP